jgi:hypothetical protein
MAIKQEQEAYEQQYLMADLESLGLSTIRLNEFNDNRELRGLVKGMKDAFIRKYRGIIPRTI